MSSFDNAPDGTDSDGYADDQGQVIEFANITYEKSDDGIALVMIDRPEKLNALNLETIDELRMAFEDARDDETIRVEDIGKQVRLGRRIPSVEIAELV